MALRINKYLKQKLVLWEKLPLPDSFGRSSYKEPVEVDCRWEDRQEEIQVAAGRTAMSNCYIMTARGMPVGSIVLEGTLATWQALPTYPALPAKNQGAYEVLKHEHTPSLKGVELLHEFWT